MQGPFTKGIEEKEILLNLDYWEEVRDTYLAKDEMIRLEELEAAKKEVEKVTGEKPITQKMFKAI